MTMAWFGFVLYERMLRMTKLMLQKFNYHDNQTNKKQKALSASSDEA